MEVRSHIYFVIRYFIDEARIIRGNANIQSVNGWMWLKNDSAPVLPNYIEPHITAGYLMRLIVLLERVFSK